jgi:hypothetical protein
VPKCWGIGNAKRTWADWKCVETKHRNSLGPLKTKTQTTLHGRYCSQLAEIKNQDKIKQNTTVAAWDNDDFWKCGPGAWSINVEEHERKTEPKPVRVFRCFLEAWELQAIRQRDIVSKNLILKKYGGMSWKDPDSYPITYELVTACTNGLEWKYGGKKYRGYHVVAKGLNYNPLNIRDEGWMIWEICHNLFGCIYC